MQPIAGARQTADVGDGRHELQVSHFQIHVMNISHRIDEDKEFC